MIDMASVILIVIAIYIELKASNATVALFSVNKGFDADLKFSVDPQALLVCDFYIINKGIANFRLERKKFKVSNRITLTHNSRNTISLRVKNVTKLDTGIYTMICDQFWVKEIILDVVDQTNVDYHTETVLVITGSNVSMLLFLSEKLTYLDKWYILKNKNGIRKAIVVNGLQIYNYDKNRVFVQLLAPSSFLVSIVNATVEEEGIYEFHAIDSAGVSIRSSKSIRLLVKELGFTYQKQPNLTTGTEAVSISLACKINSAYQIEKVYIESGWEIVSINDPPQVTYRLTPTRKHHQKKYTCRATIVEFSSVIVTETMLDILFPPSVNVEQIEDSKLRCLANGNPDNYTFRWIHRTDFGQFIRNLTESNNETLIVPYSTHNADVNGRYVCLVSNGIPDVKGEVQQRGKPFFVSTNDKMITGKLKERQVMKFSIYSFPPLESVEIETSNGSFVKKTDIIFYPPQILPAKYISHHVYGKNIKLKGFVVYVEFKMVKLQDFGTYYICAKNNICNSSLVFRIVSNENYVYLKVISVSVGGLFCLGILLSITRFVMNTRRKGIVNDITRGSELHEPETMHYEYNMNTISDVNLGNNFRERNSNAETNDLQTVTSILHSNFIYDHRDLIASSDEDEYDLITNSSPYDSISHRSNTSGVIDDEPELALVSRQNSYTSLQFNSEEDQRYHSVSRRSKRIL